MPVTQGKLNLLSIRGNVWTKMVLDGKPPNQQGTHVLEETRCVQRIAR